MTAKLAETQRDVLEDIRRIVNTDRLKDYRICSLEQEVETLRRLLADAVVKLRVKQEVRLEASSSGFQWSRFEPRR